VNTTFTSRPAADPVPADHPDTGTDWGAIDALTDEQALAAALADPDAPPASEAMLSRARRVGLAGSVRFRIGVSLADFEARYNIPAATVRAWEGGTAKPDAAMQAYLTLIDADPAGVAMTLQRARRPVAAE
jgi:putative transcriptional regulator